VELDEFVLMPNHMHGIIGLTSRTSTSRKLPTLGRIVAYFKYQSTKGVNQLRSTSGVPVWQCNYYEHIVRNQNALQQIREYIINNPQQWQLDQLNPAHISEK